MSGGGRWVSVGCAFALLVVAGCGTDSDTADRIERDASAYAGAIRDIVGPAAFAGIQDPEALVVQVHPLEAGTVIELDIQVRVLEQLEGFATVRFVDRFEEAVRVDEPDGRVVGDGVAVGLGPLEDVDSRFELQAQRYEAPDLIDGVTYRVIREGDDWTVVRSGTWVPEPLVGTSS